MKWAVYNILFALVYPFLLPGFLIRMLRRGGYAARMGDRFALYPEEVMARFLPDGKPACPHGQGKGKKEEGKSLDASSWIWIHAVSVGEVQVAGQLMRAWRAVDPSVRFCFSTTSSTGWKMALREVKGNGREEGQRLKVKGQTGDGRFHCLTSDLGPQTSIQTMSEDVLIYNPLDFPSFVKSALKLVRPRAIILTETEIWPNFIRKAKSFGIPLFLINARVSDRSAPRYRAARFFFRDVLACFTRIFAQSDLDKARLVAAGAPADRVEVTGSFKFDVARRNEAKEEELRKWIAGAESFPRQPVDANRFRVYGGKILLGGSTWPGEDVALLKIYRKLLASVDAVSSPRPVDAESFPRHPVDAVAHRVNGDGKTPLSDAESLRVYGDANRFRVGGDANRFRVGGDANGFRVYGDANGFRVDDKPILVLAPRHFEKADQVEANIRAAGFDCVRRSRPVDAGPCPRQKEAWTLPLDAGGGPRLREDPPVYLCDTTGEMMGLFGICDVAFVGKSLCAHGSQNMIEPCLCGKPTVVGPYTENFRPVMSDLLESQAIVQVPDEAALEKELIRLMTDDAAAQELGARATAAVLKRQGVVPRCVAEIRALIDATGCRAGTEAGRDDPSGRKEMSA